MNGTARRSLVDQLGFDRTPSEDHRSVSDELDLTGRTAVVTGGAGPSLGHAIVERLASQGASVVVADLDLDAARVVADRVSAQWEVPCVAVQCDVTDWTSFESAIDHGCRELGPLEILVNNVGGGPPNAPFQDNSRQSIDVSVAINLMSVLYGCRLAADRMLPRRRGAIVNVTSEAGRMPMPNLAVYGACKAGVIGFTRSVAHDLASSGIRVNAVSPGTMLTEQLQRRAREVDESGSVIVPIEYAIRATPLGRGVLPREVANAVVYLVSDAAAGVHGATYAVGGGQAG